jgi:hypothetical protein
VYISTFFCHLVNVQGDFQQFNTTENIAMPRDAGKCQHWRQVFQLNPGATNGCFGWEVVDLEPRTARIEMDCVEWI